MSTSPLSASALATTFRHLHSPGTPLLLTNVYDPPSAQAIASLPSTAALATASFAVAIAAGTTDAALSLETNLAFAQKIAAVAHQYNLPLTVDWQDGYGERLEEGIHKLLDIPGGVIVGVNLEDRGKEEHELMSIDVAKKRIGKVLEIARERGIADFVVNARCDEFLVRGKEARIEDVVERGKAYLDAGATTVFVLTGQGRGALNREEVKLLVGAFGGRLNVGLKLAGGEGHLTVRELAELGIARISLGPQLLDVAMGKLKAEAERLLASR